ncbi:MAG: hypothetical protein ACTSUO_05145 [Candidatus Thorarchaeota archaeon]
MSSICKSPKLVLMSVMLLLGLILAFSVPLTYMPPTYDRVRTDMIFQDATLTTENSLLRLNLTYSTFRVNIIELETNNTPVSIRAYNPAQFLEIQNVTLIDEVPLTIFSTSPEYNEWNEWGIILVRENSDVNVSVTAVILYYDQADVALAPPINFGIYGIPFAFIAIYWLLNVETRCRVHKTGERNWERKQGPLAIIALLLIASILVTPFAVMMGTSDFTSNHGRGYSYPAELTEAAPVITYNIDEITEGYFSEIYIDTDNKDVSVRIVGSGDVQTISWIVKEYVNPTADGWFMPFREDTPYQHITLERVSADVSADVRVDIQWTEFSFPWGIEIPAGFAAIGLLPLVLALVRAYRIDGLFRIPEEVETDYFDVDEFEEDYE